MTQIWWWLAQAQHSKAENPSEILLVQSLSASGVLEVLPLLLTNSCRAMCWCGFIYIFLRQIWKAEQFFSARSVVQLKWLSLRLGQTPDKKQG